MNKYIFFTVIFFTVFISKPSFAMGKLGHQIICQLAFEHLSPPTQDKVTTLLATIPQTHKSLINRYNYQKENQEITYASACTWADAIKRLEEFKAYNSWHYMNIARTKNSINANDCSENCLPHAILKHQQVLAHPQKDQTWQQAQALLFLGHWLGDIHQPLHISFKSDLGGNKVTFSHLTTKCSNLHWYWDQCVLYKGKQSKTTWLDTLRAQWQKKPQDHWETEQVWQWADESFKLATAPSFRYCQRDDEGTCQKPASKIVLPEDYLVQYQPVIEQRLLQAAQRLTEVLEASL